jgi:hypothetical protein
VRVPDEQAAPRVDRRAVEAVREDERLLPKDEHLREERLLLDLQARIEERLAVLAV